MPKPVELTQAGSGNFKRNRSILIEALWLLVERLLVTNSLQISSAVRVWTLRAFGAQVGKNVLFRPRTRVKFPWKLEVGDNCWVGEGVWIHNQDFVTIEDNAVVSQDTFITTGSHDIYGSMDLIVKPVVIRRGAWVTSRCIVLQGVEIGENAIAAPGSVVGKSLLANGVYRGNPAEFVRER